MAMAPFPPVSLFVRVTNFFPPGFERPSAIQQRAIVPVLKDRDVIAQAQSGTGKTATFSISVLQKIDQNLRQCQALILAPTRELAQQIQKVVIALGDLLNIEVYTHPVPSYLIV